MAIVWRSDDASHWLSGDASHRGYFPLVLLLFTVRSEENGVKIMGDSTF